MILFYSILILSSIFTLLHALPSGNGRTLFGDMPSTVLMEISKYLDVGDFGRLALTTKKLNSIFGDKQTQSAWCTKLFAVNADEGVDVGTMKLVIHACDNVNHGVDLRNYIDKIGNHHIDLLRAAMLQSAYEGNMNIFESIANRQVVPVTDNEVYEAAALGGHIDFIKALSPMNFFVPRDSDALNVAIERGNLEVIEFFAARVDCAYNMWSSYRTAAENDNYKALGVLKKNCRDENGAIRVPTSTESYEVILYTAVDFGSLNFIKAFGRSMLFRPEFHEILAHMVLKSIEEDKANLFKYFLEKAPQTVLTKENLNLAAELNKQDMIEMTWLKMNKKQISSEQQNMLCSALKKASKYKSYTVTSYLGAKGFGLTCYNGELIKSAAASEKLQVFKDLTQSISLKDRNDIVDVVANIYYHDIDMFEYVFKLVRSYNPDLSCLMISAAIEEKNYVMLDRALAIDPNLKCKNILRNVTLNRLKDLIDSGRMKFNV